MTIQRIQTNTRMSQAVKHGDTVYLAGQVALCRPDLDATGQTKLILAQIDALLAEAGSDKTRLLSATIYLVDLADYSAMNSVWDAWLPASGAPARATVCARLMLPELKVEIAVVAACDRD